MTIDLSSLSPNDATTALRSFPRRFRSAVAPIADDESIEELAQQIGPEGQSAVELVADVVRTWSLQREALRQTQLSDDPVVHGGVVDAAQRHWESPVRESVDDILQQLDDGADDLVESASRVEGDGWLRTARVAGGREITALDLLRETVRVGHDGLAAVERTLAALRR